jgi:hypothetical protein
VILEDFTEDPQKWQDTAGWQAQQLAESSGPLETPEGWAAAFKAERSGLLPRWQTAQTRFGRTTIGSFQAPSAWPMFATRFLAGALPTVPDLDTPALALRMLSDDIKALYGEAAQAEGPASSAHKIDTWFWRQTVAGRLLEALRTVSMAREQCAETVAGRFLCRLTGCPDRPRLSSARDRRRRVVYVWPSRNDPWHGRNPRCACGLPDDRSMPACIPCLSSQRATDACR